MAHTVPGHLDMMRQILAKEREQEECIPHDWQRDENHDFYRCSRCDSVTAYVFRPPTRRQ